MGNGSTSYIMLRTLASTVLTWLSNLQQKKLLKWQLAHPSGTFDDCADWLRESNAKRVKCG